MLDYGSYATELYPWCNLQLGVSKGGDQCFAPPPGSPGPANKNSLEEILCP